LQTLERFGTPIYTAGIRNPTRVNVEYVLKDFRFKVPITGEKVKDLIPRCKEFMRIRKPIVHLGDFDLELGAMSKETVHSGLVNITALPEEAHLNQINIIRDCRIKDTMPQEFFESIATDMDFLHIDVIPQTDLNDLIYVFPNL